MMIPLLTLFFFFSSRRRHTRYWRDWSSDVCSSDLARNVKYLPVSVHWAALEMGEAVRVRLASGESADVRDLDLWHLLNVDADAALDAARAFRARRDDP